MTGGVSCQHSDLLFDSERSFSLGDLFEDGRHDHLGEGVVSTISWRNQVHNGSVDVLRLKASLNQVGNLCFLRKKYQREIYSVFTQHAKPQFK